MRQAICSNVRSVSRTRKVVINCSQGQSRSTTFLAAVMIVQSNCALNPVQALERIMKSRKQICPNPAFAAILDDLHAACAGQTQGKKALSSFCSKTRYTTYKKVYDRKRF